MKQCILNSGRFSKVTEDPGAAASGWPLSLKLDRSFKTGAWPPAVYPLVLYWPLQPYTLNAVASLHANGGIESRDFAFSTDRKVAYTRCPVGRIAARSGTLETGESAWTVRGISVCGQPSWGTAGTTVPAETIRTA